MKKITQIKTERKLTKLSTEEITRIKGGGIIVDLNDFTKSGG